MHNMLNLNKHSKTRPKPNPTLNFENCSRACAYRCVRLSYTTQHGTVLIKYPSYPTDKKSDHR